MEPQKKSLSVIFREEPDCGWGSRGNPCFWEYLEERAKNKELSVTGDELEHWIKEEHLVLTGKEMTMESDVFVKAFDHGGMSSGRVTGEWWLLTGIPLLKERLNSEK
jgi:hypothetical protein